MPSSRVTRSVTAPIELAIGAGSPSWYSSAPLQRAHDAVVMRRRGVNSSSTSTRDARRRAAAADRLAAAARRRHAVHRPGDRLEQVVFPAPLGPMMPVSPAPSSSSVSSCWRKLQSRSRLICIRRRPGRARRASISPSPSRTNASRSSSAGQRTAARGSRAPARAASAAGPGAPTPTVRWISGRRRSRWKCSAVGLERADGAWSSSRADVARNVAARGAGRSCRRCRPAPRATRSAMSASTRRGGEPVGLDRLEVEDRARERHRRAARPCRGRDRPAASPCPREPCSRLVRQLAPEVGAHVLERAGVPDARRHLVLHVVVAERDVAPLVRRQLLRGRAARRRTRPRSGRTGRRPRPRRAAPAPGAARRPPAGATAASPPISAWCGTASTRQVERGIDEPARPRRPRRRRPAPRTAGGSSRSRSSAACRDCRRSARSARPGSASRSRWNCRKAKTIAALVGRTEWKRSPATTTASGRAAMTPSIASAEGVRDVGLALVDAGRGLPMVLPDAEVRIGDVGEFHPRNVSPLRD